jgi:hypothetical protein
VGCVGFGLGVVRGFLPALADEVLLVLLKRTPAEAPPEMSPPPPTAPPGPPPCPCPCAAPAPSNMKPEMIRAITGEPGISLIFIFQLLKVVKICSCSIIANERFSSQCQRGENVFIQDFLRIQSG